MTTLAPMRQAYGEALVELGATRADVVVLSADVSNSDFSWMFAEAYPTVSQRRDRGTGAGRCCGRPGHTPGGSLGEHLRLPVRDAGARGGPHALCYGGANVKLVGAYAGVSYSIDGPTHHANTVIAIMLRALPTWRWFAGDPAAVGRLLPQVAAWPGPVYMRLNRNEVPDLFDGRYAPELGRAMVHRTGGDVTLVGTGLMLSRALDAADVLAHQGIDARVVEIHTLKPFDAQAIVTAAEETGAIVTAEEHSIVGGLGGASSGARVDLPGTGRARRHCGHVRDVRSVPSAALTPWPDHDPESSRQPSARSP